MNLRHLSGWDVVAALLGMALMIGIVRLQPDSWRFQMWYLILVPLAVVARRRFLPQLSPPDNQIRLKPSRSRRIAGFATMILAGLVAAFSGKKKMGVLFATKDPSQIVWAAIPATIFGGALWLFSVGMRWVG